MIIISSILQRGRTALHEASTKAYNELVVECLLNHGAKVNSSGQASRNFNVNLLTMGWGLAFFCSPSTAWQVSKLVDHDRKRIVYCTGRTALHCINQSRCQTIVWMKAML